MLSNIMKKAVFLISCLRSSTESIESKMIFLMNKPCFGIGICKFPPILLYKVTLLLQISTVHPEGLILIVDQ